MIAAALLATFGAAASPAMTDYRARPPQDEVIYFVLPDRFANGDPANDHGGPARGKLVDGFDPTDKAFYHGGDLKGLTARLDYIRGLGVTALWLGPIFRNKAVQGAPGHESAGYHGYWITDFTEVDPHFGTKAEFKALVDGAHARGLKVYLDIIANHTADVIKYRECPPDLPCPYRSRADYPYTRAGGLAGRPINQGFLGDDGARQTEANFAALTEPDYAYTPYVPPAEAHVKQPDWLNDPRWYHNRGDSFWVAESAQLGDFGGLDDLFTENPRVVRGFIEIYGGWIDRFGVDGFRIDTARHVNPEFWQAFVPAMIARAKADGIPNFHVFGEVFDPDPATLARYTRVDRYPAVLDFAFQATVVGLLARGAGTDTLARLFAADAIYADGEATARMLPTFLGNHDMGRIGFFRRQAMKGADDATLLKADLLAHALMFAARGTPVIYYGDEQGFTGDGGDQDARQDMFPSRVASYNGNREIGSAGTTATASFRTDTPLYRAIATLARIRAGDAALRGGRTAVRAFGDRPGLFAFSRILDGRETLIALNTGATPIDAQVPVDATSGDWRELYGRCEPQSSAPGSYRVRLAPLDIVICAAAAGRAE